MRARSIGLILCFAASLGGCGDGGSAAPGQTDDGGVTIDLAITEAPDLATANDAAPGDLATVDDLATAADLAAPIDLAMGPADLAPGPDLAGACVPLVVSDAGAPMVPWKLEYPPAVTVDVMAVWGSAPNDMYFVGKGNTILHSTDGGKT